jgi:hypothetical protein
VIAPALRATVRKQPNTRAVWAEVHDFDLDAKLVWAEQPYGAAVDIPYARPACGKAG